MMQDEWGQLTGEQQRFAYMDAWSRAALAEISLADLRTELDRIRGERDAATEAVLGFIRPCPHCHEGRLAAEDCICLDGFDRIVDVLDRIENSD